MGGIETLRTKEENWELEGKILHFYSMMKAGKCKDEYKEYFSITSSRQGIIKKNEGVKEEGKLKR